MKLHYVDFVDFSMQREEMAGGKKMTKNWQKEEAQLAASG